MTVFIFQPFNKLCNDNCNIMKLQENLVFWFWFYPKLRIFSTLIKVNEGPDFDEFFYMPSFFIGQLSRRLGRRRADRRQPDDASKSARVPAAARCTRRCTFAHEMAFFFWGAAHDSHLDVCWREKRGLLSSQWQSDCHPSPRVSNEEEYVEAVTYSCEFLS